MVRKMLLFALFAGLMQSTACSEENSSETRAKPAARENVAVADYLALVPKEASVLFYANLHDLRNTPLGEEFRLDEDDEDYRDFVERTGVAPEKDIDACWIGTLTGKMEDKGGVIATGRFDEKRIVKYFKEESRNEFEETTYRGYTIFSAKDHEDNPDMVFLDARAVVVGSPVWVRAVLDRAKGDSESVMKNPAMAQQIEKVREGNQLWGVVNLADSDGQWARDLKKKSPFSGTESLKNIQSLVFFTQVGEKADMHVRGNFTTAEEASLLAETVTGFKAMAKLMMADDREAIDLLNEIKIAAEGETLEISARLDRKFMDKLKEKKETFSKGPVKLL